ncbi:precorrin-6Y C5,15-methyltransferase (decarboxylating) subunit CbiT, partial [Desulfosarcina sp. OttesenSCG-928-B08]|nr:precorrin-6Y C5,15-methyltransferase (decarboxylating) subunit CbiT [Desulfosarcina sp. OttesenSCG-928-B08]
HILEDLGSPAERISCLGPETAAMRTFSDLNMVILKPNPGVHNRPVLCPGMPDEAFVHENGLITKAEVRAVTLSRLQLFDQAVFWDLGAGSGAISIEAGSRILQGQIFAVEKEPSRVRQIEENQKRFGVANLGIVTARLPEGLSDLPDPDRVFVGGGGKDIGDIVHAAAIRLSPGGILVVNTVLMDSLMAARQALTELGFSVDLIQIQVNQAVPMPFSFRFSPANPVWILTGRKVGESHKDEGWPHVEDRLTNLFSCN